MGRVTFPLIGNLHLCATIDDHSRFIHHGRFFYNTYKVNVFRVMYRAFVRYGLPKALLSDKGSQFRANRNEGEADYQYYCKKLGIGIVYGKRAQTKGKIERLWRFIQRDFVMENLHVTSLKELNKRFLEWIEKYNFNHSHKGLNRDCPADIYHESLRKLNKDELEFILVHEESRKVLRTASVSYYGQYYRVPAKYINRRVWTRLKGDILIIECGEEIIGRYEVKDFKNWYVKED